MSVCFCSVFYVYGAGAQAQGVLSLVCWVERGKHFQCILALGCLFKYIFFFLAETHTCGVQGDIDSDCHGHHLSCSVFLRKTF